MSVMEVLFELLVVLIKTLGTVCVSLFRCVIPEPFKSVREKVILVTGSAGGLGRLLAQKFALLGAKVVLVDIDEVRNNETLQNIKSMQCKAYAYTCDVSNENQVEALADKVFREVGDVDILINNAGVLPGKPLFDLTNAQIKKTFAINSLSHMWMIRQFLPRMLDRGEGHIVAIASVAGILGCSYLVDYCASKHAVIGLMAALREELHEMGREEQIQLTVICPSTMNTGMVQNPKTRFPSLLPILDVDKASDIIVQSVLRDKRFVVIPTFVHVIYKFFNLFPPQVPLLLQRFLGYTIDPNVK
ncbi:Protein dhs-3 like protein [Argiope bruennichi]|uniref:Short-chain dehydrogenase/reductase 3 n=1 Tax=Argiope bruennichi TaxID=94029 RepID=A0A8T0FYJ1_ARGBR|nr:Protein dhs-3 like protein [Argiope bruennichi]